MTKRTVVIADQRRYFDTKSEARQYAIKLLEAGLTFIEILQEEN